MDAAFNYDQHGQPIDADVRLMWKEQAEYVHLVELGSAEVQGPAYAIKVYIGPGRLGFMIRFWNPFKRSTPKRV